jgi:hypothetical protein
MAGKTISGIAIARRQRSRPQPTETIRAVAAILANERCSMKNATELLTAYLAQIQDPAAAAALFADDGVIELPWINARA